LEQREEAVIACQAGLARFPDDVELLFLHGLLLQEMEDFEGAEVCLLRLFQTDPKGLFASVDAGIRGYKARHNLAIVYSRQGKAAEAEAQWRAALAERPNYPAAWLGLGELFLLQGRWEEAAVAIQRLEESPAEQEKAVLLRAKLHLARQEFEAGRRLLANVIGSFPQALAPRVLLSELLLQEGRDWDAAEEALLTVLKFDPGHVQARRNLTLLRCQPGRALKGRSEHTQQFKHGAR
jgi:tetratricopeptide (TPR) repeat protein